MIFDKEKLLSVYDQTKDAEPMKSHGAGGNAMSGLGEVVSVLWSHLLRLWANPQVVVGTATLWARLPCGSCCPAAELAAALRALCWPP